MHLIVGLGNPGQKYQLTRHNIGFMVVDALNQNFGDGSYKTEHKAFTAKIRLGSKVLLIAKPQTFMNLSGEAVEPLLSYYDVPIENLLIVHDEIDLPYKTIRYQCGGNSGGHNGIKSVYQMTNTQAVARLRLGVSRPSNPKQDVADYVLQNFNNDELQSLPDFLSVAAESIESFVNDGWQESANKYNGLKL